MKIKTQTKKKVAAKTDKPETVLVLKTCSAQMTTYNGFKWPESGPIEAPDWKPSKQCGNGFHGWLWGHGDWSLKAKGEDIRWLVIEVEKASLIDLNGKVKFPEGHVVGCFGHWRDAMAFIRARRPVAEQTTVATGNYGHASATGDYGHASATGNSGHASATGYYGHASATGDSGHASATGYSGHASATGDSGWSAAGYKGRAKAGKDGVLTLLYWDDSSKRPRVVVGYVEEEGIEADTWYEVENAKLVKAKE
jgi:hypothetical protein